MTKIRLTAVVEASGLYRVTRLRVARIVVRVVVFEAERADGSHLGDVLAGLRPVEVPGVTG
jgi:hypothetical protein